MMLLQLGVFLRNFCHPICMAVFHRHEIYRDYGEKDSASTFYRSFRLYPWRQSIKVSQWYPSLVLSPHFGYKKPIHYEWFMVRHTRPPSKCLFFEINPRHNGEICSAGGHLRFQPQSFCLITEKNSYKAYGSRGYAGLCLADEMTY